METQVELRDRAGIGHPIVAARHQAQPSTKISVERFMADRRVYVVDDDSALRLLVRRMLADSGAHVEEFGSAEEFLSGYSERPIGCVLLDVRLPGIGGLQVLERVSRSRPANPIIMVSGFGDIPSAVKAVKSGALDFVQKPFQKAQLLDVVNRAFDTIANSVARDQELESLTSRERDVLKALRSGAANKIVAAELGLSPRTVEMHRSRIFKKLGVSNLAQALLRVRDVRF